MKTELHVENDRMQIDEGKGLGEETMNNGLASIFQGMFQGGADHLDQLALRQQMLLKTKQQMVKEEEKKADRIKDELSSSSDSSDESSELPPSTE